MPPSLPTVKSIQDIPPKDGFPKVRINRLNPPRGPSGAAIFTTVTLGVIYGFIMVAKTNEETCLREKEHRDSKLSLAAYFAAEYDLNFEKHLNYQLAEEARIMKNRKDWKVGESVYSRRWSPPVYGSKLD